MSEKEPRIVKANHLLQAKVGMGNIEEKKIRRSQKVMDNMAVDFTPMAEEYLGQLAAALEAVRQGDQPAARKIQLMTDPVMQIKANAAMFDYALVGVLANVMLNFLEALEDVDNDVLDIVDANHKTMRLLVSNKMKGDGGEYGKELQAELKDACRRYFTKMAINRREDNDVFFIDG